MAIQHRFDKQGRQLPDSGRGCGCQLCAESKAARYERRREERSTGTWGPWRRRLLQVVQSGGRHQQAV